MNKLQKIIATGLMTLPLVMGVPGCNNIESKNNAGTVAVVQDRQQSGLRDVVLSYLSQPKFSNPDFLKQITGTDAEFQMLDLKDEMVYLSIPKSNCSKDTFKELTLNLDAVEFGKTANGDISGDRIRLGDYILRKSGSYFFRFPIDDFRVDESDMININYKSTNYSLTMQELQDFADKKSIYGGDLKAVTSIDKQGVYHIVINHGAYVAKKGEKSLERLVDSLTGDENLKERKAQKLLDFVTRELKYDYSDVNPDYEIMKRPNEVLMTKGSDCSGKIILYASLLEQTNTDYRLIYMDDHIAVAVEGDYSDRNELDFNLGDKIYSIAETTANGFQIGASMLNMNIADIKYIQKPGLESKIYNAKTGDVLPFF